MCVGARVSTTASRWLVQSQREGRDAKGRLRRSIGGSIVVGVSEQRERAGRRRVTRAELEARLEPHVGRRVELQRRYGTLRASDAER